MARTGLQLWTWVALMHLSTPLMAQQADDGGMQLTLGISQSLGVTRNPDFDPGDTDISPLATTGLALGYLTETRSQRVAIDLQSSLSLDDTGAEIESPLLSFDYDRMAADAELSVDGSLQRVAVNSLRNLADFTSADGTILLPADIDTLNLSGNRTTSQIGAALSWGKTAPVGYRLGTSLTALTYDGNAAAVLPNSSTLSFDGGVRLNITSVLQSNVGLQYTIYNEDGSPQTDRINGSLGLAFDRPSGNISTTFTANETDSGTRFELQLGRTFNLPRTNLTAGTGLSVSPDGVAQLTGQLGYIYSLPNGQIDLTASRSFASATDGTERRLTTVSVNYTTQLTHLSTLRLGFDYSETRDDNADLARSASLQAAQSFQLTQDWALSVGGQAELRNETDVDQARSETFFVSLGRTFTFRP